MTGRKVEVRQTVSRYSDYWAVFVDGEKVYSTAITEDDRPGASKRRAEGCAEFLRGVEVPALLKMLKMLGVEE